MSGIHYQLYTLTKIKLVFATNVFSYYTKFCKDSLEFENKKQNKKRRKKKETEKKEKKTQQVNTSNYSLNLMNF